MLDLGMAKALCPNAHIYHRRLEAPSSLNLDRHLTTFSLRDPRVRTPTYQSRLSKQKAVRHPQRRLRFSLHPIDVARAQHRAFFTLRGHALSPCLSS